MTSKITGGSVVYARTVQPKEYESQRAEVTINFDTGEGDHTAILNEAGKIAKDKAHELLGLKSSTSLSSTTPAPKAADPAPPANDKAKLAEDAKAGGKGKGGKKASKPPAASEPDPADMGGSQEDPTEDLTSAADDPANLEEDLTSAAPAEITDEAVVAEITKTNARIKDAPAIRQLIGKYVQAPKGAKDIPQENRAAFIADLGKLNAK